MRCPTTNFCVPFATREKRRPKSSVDKNVIERIEAKTEWAGECLEWTGAINNKSTRTGYGAIKVGSKTKRVTRLIMEDVVGRSLMLKEYVLHTCDNTRCVNPFHLYIGDQFRNMADMYSRGRGNKATGYNNGRNVYLRRLREGEIKDGQKRKRL